MRDKQIAEMGEYIAEAAYSKCAIVTSCDRCKWHDSTNQKADCLDYLIAETLYNAGYRKATDVARGIFEEVMQALEKGVAEANKTILDKTRIFTEELICTGEMYAGHIGKSICEVFKKYESEGEG